MQCVPATTASGPHWHPSGKTSSRTRMGCAHDPSPPLLPNPLLGDGPCDQSPCLITGRTTHLAWGWVGLSAGPIWGGAVGSGSQPKSWLFGGLGSGTRVALSTTRHPQICMPHQWLEGNLPVSAKCAVCEKTCGSVLRLQDWRCLWCKAMVSGRLPLPSPLPPQPPSLPCPSAPILCY